MWKNGCRNAEQGKETERIGAMKLNGVYIPTVGISIRQLRQSNPDMDVRGIGGDLSPLLRPAHQTALNKSISERLTRGGNSVTAK